MSGFNTAVSGIRAASSALDVTGNNIANASTTGFKSSRTEFADIYATSIVGSGSNIPGSGVLVSDIAQDFSGGTVIFTNNNLDLSIDGSGFFQLDDGNGNVSYTRDGSFELDKDGFIVSKGGVNLQGVVFDEDGAALPISDLAVTEKSSLPQATTEMSLSFNIDESSDASDLLANYSPDEAGSYTFSTTVGAFNEIGNEPTIRYDFVEQRAQKEVHTYDQAAVGAFTIAGVTVDTSTMFATSDSLNKDTSAAAIAAWDAIEENDPRIFDIQYDAAALEVKVIFKSEAYEYGEVVVDSVALGQDLSNEVVSYIDSNETHSFALDPAGIAADASFSIAGVTFNLSAPLTQEEIANTIIAEQDAIRSSEPTIESISYDQSSDSLIFTFLASSGDISSDVAIEVEDTSGFFTDAQDVDGYTIPGSIVDGDNSYQGVYRMYAYLNPEGGGEAVLLDLGKPEDPDGGVTLGPNGEVLVTTEEGPILVKFNSISGVLSEINGEPASVGVDAPSITVSSDIFPDFEDINLDLTGSTQIDDDQIVNGTDQNGFGKGDLTGVSFDANGEMRATYSNNQNTLIGIVQIATFDNQAGLQPSGDNQWIATSASGNAILNAPGTGLNGNLRSSALEASNVDLSAELVKLIEYQRNFQASSQTLETLNTVTQTILQI
jgi:flagellar hook protein FlgE